MKQTIKEDLGEIMSELRNSVTGMELDNHCLLESLEHIKEKMMNVEMKAATFYLNCYLSPFTEKYLELSICVQNLSTKRHGGLIVIQRDDPLDAFIQPGIPIGAELTHSLLESIFFPGNPLHDGAVLVNHNQIVSAANVLPLSHRYNGTKKLGTRHRAAIGLSERSDALVMVVSEETGRISFAFNGSLHPLTSHDFV